jgi:hypothetical protein
MAARGNTQEDTTPTDLFSSDAATCVIAGAMEAGKWLPTVSPSKCPATLLHSLEQFPAFSTAERIHQKRRQQDLQTNQTLVALGSVFRFNFLRTYHGTSTVSNHTCFPALRAPSFVPGSKNGLEPQKSCRLLFPV